MIEDVSFAVLAGGRSSRMGTDKKLLRWRGGTFLKAALNCGADFSDRIVSLATNGNDALERELRRDGICVVRDARADVGPLEGIGRVLRAAKNDACFVVATDMPFLQRDLVAKMVGRYSGKGNLVLMNGGRREPLLSIYCRECIPGIERLIGENRLRPAFLFDEIRTEYISLEELGFGSEQVRNINSAEEYRQITGEISE